MPANAPPVNPLVAAFALLLLLSIFGAWVWAIVRLALGRSIPPRFAPRVVPWGVGSVALGVVAWLALQIVVLKGYALVARGGGPGPAAALGELQPADAILVSAISNGAVVVLVPLLLVATAGARGRDLGLTRGDRPGRRALQGMLAWPLIAPPVYGAMIVAVRVWGPGTHPLEKAIRHEGIGQNSAILFLASVVLAPMAEELIFRGVLLGWLTRQVLTGRVAREDRAHQLAEVRAATDRPDESAAEARIDDLPAEGAGGPRDEFAPPPTDLGPPPSRPDPGDPAIVPRWGAVAGRLLAANVVVSVLFAGLHAAVWPTPVPILLLSLVLGLLYQRTGSLVAPVALHMTFNAVSTILMFLSLAGPAPAEPGPAPTPSVAPITNPVPAPVPAP